MRPPRPDVSVVIPTHNRAHLVQDAIESALAQEFVSLEVIVVDDGSIDDTKSVLAQYGRNIETVSQANQGLEAARNAGISRAKGRYVQFVDDDDYILPGKLSEQVAYLDSHDEVDVVYSPWVVMNRFGDCVRCADTTPVGDLRSTLIAENFAPIHSFLFRRETVVAIGGFDPDSLKWEDWDFLFRLAFAGTRFSRIGDVSSVYRIHGGNMMIDVGNVYQGASRWQLSSLVSVGISPFRSDLGRRSIAFQLLDQFAHFYRHCIRNSMVVFCDAVKIYPQILLENVFCDKLIDMLEPAENVYCVDIKGIVEDYGRVLDLWEWLSDEATKVGIRLSERRGNSRIRESLMRSLDGLTRAYPRTHGTEFRFGSD